MIATGRGGEAGKGATLDARREAGLKKGGMEGGEGKGVCGGGSGGGMLGRVELGGWGSVQEAGRMEHWGFGIVT